MWKNHDDIHPVLYDDTFLTNPLAGEIVASYFYEPWNQLIYPAKAFAVALVYAKLIEKYFGTNMYDALKDTDLLLGDRYFYDYQTQPQIYDTAINVLNRRELWDFESSNVGQVQSTVEYFKREFWLD